MPLTIIDLFRHGEAAPGICLGAAWDAPLTPNGWRQMRSVADGSRVPWQGVVCSPLIRCSAFARELAERHCLPLTVEPDFRELGFGRWEGKSWAELYATHGESLTRFQRLPGSNPAPDGEDYASFEARVVRAWSKLLAAGQGRHWLLVTHAGVLRTLLRQILGFPRQRLFAIQIPHAVLTRIERLDGASPRLIFHAGRP